MVVTYKDDIATLDPAIGHDWQNWSIIKSLFDGLMDYEPGTTNLRPNLAESYEMSPDGLNYVFKLRSGVKFHNGRALKAEDIKYSIERAVNPALHTGYVTLNVTMKPFNDVKVRKVTRSPPASAPT
jgi:ABC-type transport system substrate-binding protein